MTATATDKPTTGNAKLRQHGLVSYTAATLEHAEGWRTVYSGGAACALPATGWVLKVEGTHQAAATKALSQVRVTIASGTRPELVAFAKRHGINLNPTA